MAGCGSACHGATARVMSRNKAIQQTKRGSLVGERGCSKRLNRGYKLTGSAGVDDELSKGVVVTVQELPTAKSGVEHPRPARAFSPTRLLIYVGAAGTLIFVLNGAAAGLSRLSQRGAMDELMVIIPLWALIGVWMLSPYWGALVLHRRRTTTRGDGVVVGIVVLAIIALGANSFLATSAFVGGKPHPTADGTTIVLIPSVQWVVLAGAALLLRLGRAVRHQ